MYIVYYAIGSKYRGIGEICKYVNGNIHGYYKKYNMFGMPTSVLYYEHGKYMNLMIIFDDNGSINYEKSQIPNEYNIASIVENIFKDININECMEKKRLQDEEDALYFATNY
jgi:hypothetical protein